MHTSIVRWAIVVASLAAFACGGGGGGSNWQSHAAIGETCATPGGQIASGEYIVANDTYSNTQATTPATPIPDAQFSQCAALATGATSGLQASWAWSWPAPASLSQAITRATPSIKYGFKPWDPQSTTPKLPALVSNIASLTVDADVSQTVGAGLDSTFGVVVYLTTADHKTGSGPLPFTKRFFIYRNWYPAYTPSSPLASQIAIDGLQWDLETTSYYVMYTPHADSDVPATSLHIDVAHFLADAVDRGLIDDSLYVASVETAEILYAGAGALTLDNYVVKVTPR